MCGLWGHGGSLGGKNKISGPLENNMSQGCGSVQDCAMCYDPRTIASVRMVWQRCLMQLKTTQNVPLKLARTKSNYGATVAGLLGDH